MQYLHSRNVKTTEARLENNTGREKGREKMYRDYEDPGYLNELVKEAKERYELAKEAGEDEDELFRLYEDIRELEDRLNFAYQDAEY